MIDGPQEVVHLAVDFHLHLVEVPPPLAALAHAFDAPSADFGREDWSETVLSVANSFVADLDAAFVEDILQLPQGQREADVEHYRETDDRRTGLEVSERGALGLKGRVEAPTTQSNGSSSDIPDPRRSGTVPWDFR